MESGKFSQREVAEVEAEAIQQIVGFSGVSDSKQSACSVGDLGSIPGLGRSPGGEHGKPLQYRESPWTEEPGGLQSKGLQRVEHD